MTASCSAREVLRSVLTGWGWVENYEMRISGRAYRLAFAKPRELRAIEFGRETRESRRRDRALRGRGWVVVRL